MIRHMVVWGMILLVGIGCGRAGLKGVGRGSRTDSSMLEDLDPLTLNDDDISPEDIRSLWMTPARPQPLPGVSMGDSLGMEGTVPDTVEVDFSLPDSGAVKRIPITVENISGWRVQLSAYTSLGAAEEAMEEVRRRFDVAVYNEFEPPWYKIRVGDCRTEVEADRLVRTARRRGYADAFKVRTRIVVEGSAGD